ncbi:MAG: NAD(+) synthase [Firmicutes bacterium]|nr:NAD(+) synthase [Bacillota bacterium]
MDTAELTMRLVTWLKEKVAEAGAKGVVFGLSGGIDSAVVAGLAKRAFPDMAMGVIMPCHSLSEDAEHARLVAERFKLPVQEVVLDATYDALVGALKVANLGEPKVLALANIKPRLRMTTLYYIAAQNNYLVLGSTNKSEWTIGYFTKHADSGVDLLPIVGLVKEQVRELARYLGVPQVIIEKPPSAGLWEGQTDENEMGLTYSELDRFILNGEGSPEVVARVRAMRARSEHKRRFPQIPSF